ncbi:hypothetical protein PAESOLCIP111_04370 [Paenibacillus solanacearum]|uniref:Uncharacterized protein n=1 Tax=Paenibacillus solanacearum TaxID=2048548 RepID=A0A916K803_9BACL|nr:CBO0543 family protein [Paenibacillus solanacearum]CAG7642687.1 hypothetical protein PAESOLCIP111_04370 [Paenibacillus solanacearum]
MERIILIGAWIVSITALIVFVPLRRWREAAVAFMAGQSITWITSITFVEWGLFENPVREFTKATSANFTFNFIFYPTVGALHCLYYPYGKSLAMRVLSSVSIPTVLVGLLLLVRTHTQLLRYIHYTWYINWLVFVIGYFAVRKYYEWFFQIETAGKAARGAS